jgi:D-serine deaminase-like pyridoxal phosphate-dependent protein
LRALSEKVKLAVVADNRIVIDGLSAVFARSERALTVLVECNTGADRCGVVSPENAAELADAIVKAPGLAFGGLMTYPPTGDAASVQAFMVRAKTLIEKIGLTVSCVSSGGTPDMMSAHTAPITTEYRPGTYVYNDRSLVSRGNDCALTVLTTVVSTPAANRAIVDAGSKILTSDLLGLSGYGHVLGWPDIAIDQLSEEHGRLTAADEIGLKVGQRVKIVPNHACVVRNMVDAVYVVIRHQVIATWPVVARGKII